MQRAALLAALCAFLILPLFTLAQGGAVDGSSGGSADGSTPPTPIEPQPSEPAPQDSKADPVPVSAPEAVPASSAGSATPRPAPTEPSLPEVPVETPTPLGAGIPADVHANPVSQTGIDPMFVLYALAGVAALGAAGFGIWKLLTGGAAGAVRDCSAIQKQLEARKQELAETEGSLQQNETLLQMLERTAREKVEEKVSEKQEEVQENMYELAKDKALGTNTAQREAVEKAEDMKETAEEIAAKIEEVKKLLEGFGYARTSLTNQVSALETAYAVCTQDFSKAGALISNASGAALPEIPELPGIKAVIFDWGGVLAADGYWVWARTHVKRLDVLAGVDNKVDSAEISHEEFLKIITDVSGESAAQVWAGVKREILLNEETIKIARALKKDYKVALLSNFTAPWLREIIDNAKLWDLFDAHIISSEHKMIKPDPAIYRAMLEMLAVEPHEAIFVDDRQKNVDAANALGIRGVLFTTAPEFLKQLKDLGANVSNAKS